MQTLAKEGTLNPANSASADITPPKTFEKHWDASTKVSSLINGLVYKNRASEVGRGIDLVSFLLGIPFVLGFYTVMIPFQGTYLGQLLRGQIPIVIMYLTFVAVTALALKFIGSLLQARAFRKDLLPSQISLRLNTANAGQFLEYLHKLEFSSRNLLVNRVHHGLEFLSAKGKSRDVVDALETQSAIDAQKIVAGYGYISLIVWALPILGFIGTVLGIGAAVGEFSGAVNAAEDMTIVKNSLTGVTSGLAFSFNTTLLALVMSMLVMFPKKFVQKTEESLLTRIDCYIQQNFCKRLEDEAVTQSRIPDESAMLEHLQEMQTVWLKSIQAIGVDISNSVANAVESSVLTMANVGNSMAEELRKTAAEFKKTGDDIKNTFSLPGKSYEMFCLEIAKIEDKRTEALEQLSLSGDQSVARINATYKSILPVFEKNRTAMSELIECQRLTLQQMQPQVVQVDALVQQLADHIQTINERVTDVGAVELSARSQQVLESMYRSNKRSEAVLKSQAQILTVIARAQIQRRLRFDFASWVEKIRLFRVKVLESQNTRKASHAQEQ